MTDSLRGVVAKVLAAHVWSGVHCECGAALDTFWTSHVAAAVLDALRLDIEHGCPTAGHHGCRCAHRYVTEWITDET